MKRGVILIIGVAVLLVFGIFFILAARNSKKTTGPTVTTLSVWSPFDEGKYYQAFSRPFLNQNPNVRLDFKFVDAKDAQDYEAKVVDAIANGTGPDIWLVRSDWVPKHAPKSLPAMPKNKGDDPIAIVKDQLEGAAVDANIVDGTLYGIPLSVDTLAVIYNASFYNTIYDSLSKDGQAVLEKSPDSWDTVKAQTAIVSQVSGNKVSRSAIALGNVDTTFAPVDVLAAMLTQNGATVLSADKKNVALNLATYKNTVATFPGADALDLYTSFARPGQANYTWNSTMGDPIDAFLQGKTGAIIGYYSTLQQILNRDPKFTVKVAALPQKDPKTDRIDYGVTWSHIVNKDSKNGSLAWGYLSTLISDQTQDFYSTRTNKISALKKEKTNLASGLVAATQAQEKIFALQVKTMKPFVKPEWQKVDEVLQDAIRQVVDLGKTSQNSLDSAVERLKDFTVQ